MLTLVGGSVVSGDIVNVVFGEVSVVRVLGIFDRNDTAGFAGKDIAEQCIAGVAIRAHEYAIGWFARRVARVISDLLASADPSKRDALFV